MASINISTNSKGQLVAKIQVSCKDIRTGQNKIKATRVYNEDNLTEAKFKKLVNKTATEFEEKVLQAYKDELENTARILSFPELMKEWKTTIKRNLSHNYLLRAEDLEKKFNLYLHAKNLYHKPVSDIKVRDIQLFFNEYMEEREYDLPYYTLKQNLCKHIPKEDLVNNELLLKCSKFRKNRIINLTLKNARMLCNKYSLEFNDFFEKCTKTIKYSLTTIKGYRRILRTVFNEALRYDWITKNPVCFTKVTAKGNNGELNPVSEKEVFSIQESQKFLELLTKEEPQYIHRTIPLKIMLLTGLRNGEIHGLRWSDINFEKRTISITKSRQYSPQKGHYEKGPKSTTSKREVPIPDYLLRELENFKDWFRIIDDDFDNKLDDYYISVNMYREPCTPSGLDDWLKRFEIKNNLKRVCCHGLRHTYCSLLLSQNVPIQTVSKYMGHADSTITLKVYAHFLPDTQNLAVNALNNIIK